LSFVGTPGAADSGLVLAFGEASRTSALHDRYINIDHLISEGWSHNMMMMMMMVVVVMMMCCFIDCSVMMYTSLIEQDGHQCR
jgi:hypothetical protein